MAAQMKAPTALGAINKRDFHLPARGAGQISGQRIDKRIWGRCRDNSGFQSHNFGAETAKSNESRKLLKIAQTTFRISALLPLVSVK